MLLAEAFYSFYITTTLRSLWLRIKTERTPHCHEFTEAQAIPTIVCLTTHYLTHWCTDFSHDLENRAPKNPKNIPNGNKFEETAHKEHSWARDEKNHVFIFQNSFSFSQKTCLKLTSQHSCIFPLMFFLRTTHAIWVEFDQYKSILEPLETMSMC